MLGTNITKRKLQELDEFIRGKQLAQGSTTPSHISQSSLAPTQSNFNLIRTPPNGTLRRVTSTGSLNSSVKTLLSHEQHQNLISKFREKESSQLETWKQMRKQQQHQMLRTSQDDQSSMKRTADNFFKKVETTPEESYTLMIEQGRANSTENQQRKKQPVNSMSSKERLDEIAERRKREQDLFMEEQAREKARHQKMKQEKNSEFQREIRHMLQNKEEYNRIREDLARLKLEKKRRQDEALLEEKNQIVKHVQDLDQELDRQIRTKQEELDNWSSKMEVLVQATPQDYEVQQKRQQWEDRNIEQRNAQQQLQEHHKRDLQQEMKQHNKQQVLNQIGQRQRLNMKDVDGLDKEKQTLKQELDEWTREEERKKRQRSADALDNKRKLEKIITEQVVTRTAGPNNMRKEQQLNKKLVDKIKCEIF